MWSIRKKKTRLSEYLHVTLVKVNIFKQLTEEMFCVSDLAALNPDRIDHVLLGPSRVPDRLGREAVPGLQ